MKKQILSALVLSTVILAAAPGAFAEDIVIGGDVEPVVTNPVTEDVVIGDQTGVVEEPVVTSPSADETVIGEDTSTVVLDKEETGLVVEPSTPDESKETPKDETVITVQPVDPKVEEKEQAEEPATTTTTTTSNRTPGKSDEKTEPTTPDDGAVKPTNPQEPKTGEVKKAEEETGASSTGQAKPVTISVIETPIVTNKGVEIVGTQDGQVLVKTETGAVEIKPATAVGAVKQSDGTVAVKDKSGKLQVLPSTGDKGTAVLVVLGLLTLLGALMIKYQTAIKKFFSELV